MEMYQTCAVPIAQGLTWHFSPATPAAGELSFAQVRSALGPDLRRVDYFGPRDEEWSEGFLRCVRSSSESAREFGSWRQEQCAALHWRRLELHAGRSTGFMRVRYEAGEKIPGLIGWEWHGDPAQFRGLQ